MTTRGWFVERVLFQSKGLEVNHGTHRWEDRGARGIGIARAFAHEGAKLALVDIDASSLRVRRRGYSIAIKGPRKRSQAWMRVVALTARDQPSCSTTGAGLTPSLFRVLVAWVADPPPPPMFVTTR